jgi:hypothetical protein
MARSGSRLHFEGHSRLKFQMRDRLATENSSKLLRVEMENYSHQHENGNVLKRTSMDINLFNKSL